MLLLLFVCCLQVWGTLTPRALQRKSGLVCVGSYLSPSPLLRLNSHSNQQHQAPGTPPPPPPQIAISHY